MNLLFRLLASFAVCGVLPACVLFPVPHDLAPKISGVVLENGVPVEGAEVVLVRSYLSTVDATQVSKDQRSISTRSDSSGRFAVGPIKTVKVVHMFGDELLVYALVIRHNGQSLLGFRDSGTGSAGGPFSVTCDLARPKKYLDSTIYCEFQTPTNVQP